MSTRRAYVILCDHRGCPEEYNSGRSDLGEAVGDAEGNHWRQQLKGKRWIDLCPDHRRDTPTQKRQ